MNSIFGEVISDEFTGLQIKRGGTYNGKKFGKNSPDETYIEAGLYPIVGDAPIYDPSIERLDAPAYEVGFEIINRTYAVIPLTEEQLDSIAYNEDMMAVNAITVDYQGRTYSGSEAEQANMVSAMAKLTGQGQSAMATWFDINNKKKKLKEVDFQNILGLVYVEQEVILDS